MASQFNFLTKVVLLSTLLSVLIKYGGMRLPLNPTQTNALIAIFLPPSIVALALWWRVKKGNSTSNDSD